MDISECMSRASKVNSVEFTDGGHEISMIMDCGNSKEKSIKCKGGTRDQMLIQFMDILIDAAFNGGLVEYKKDL